MIKQFSKVWEKAKLIGLDPRNNYRQPCVATQPIMFYVGLLSAALRSNAPIMFYVSLFIYFFIHRSFSETTRPIHTKFSGIVYSSVVWIIR